MATAGLTTGDGPEVARLFGLPPGELAGPAARGELGQVWRLTNADGDWAVKESFVPQEAASAGECGRFQADARAAGVPTPRVLTTPAGDHVSRLRDVPLRAYAWVDVLGADRTIDPVAVGRTLAALHRVHRSAAGPPHPWFTEPVGAGRWRELARAAAAARAPFAGRLAAVVEELVAAERLLVPMTPVQLCHLDLWADNVRATPSGGLSVLDFDNAGPGDPGQELAMVLYEFGGAPERVRALRDGYLDAGGPGRVREPADFSLPVAHLGHIAERHLRMWLEAAGAGPVRSHATAALDELLADPLTPATIEAILAALAT